VYAHHRVAALFGAAVALLLSGAVMASPASAHGALSSPVSRTAACGTEGGAWLRSAACTAALAASGRSAFTDWDAERVSGVNGRDREVIPDGKLCSGGLPQFRGLDLPRTDWPTTTLASGAGFRFSYRATIGHAGSFRLYLTTDDYRPTAALTWAKIEPKPFLTVTDPPLASGAYTLSGRLPRKTGRHVIYAIWQNSSSADTYYSCSDVVFRASGPTNGGPGGGGAGGPTPGRPTGQAPATTPKRAPAPGAKPGLPPARGPAAPGGAARTAPGGEPRELPAIRSVSWTSRDPTRLVLTATGAAVLLAAAALLVAVRRR
jgi:chitin-binding protein